MHPTTQFGAYTRPPGVSKHAGSVTTRSSAPSSESSSPHPRAKATAKPALAASDTSGRPFSAVSSPAPASGSPFKKTMAGTAPSKAVGELQKPIVKDKTPLLPTPPGLRSAPSGIRHLAPLPQSPPARAPASAAITLGSSMRSGVAAGAGGSAQATATQFAGGAAHSAGREQGTAAVRTAPVATACVMSAPAAPAAPAGAGDNSSSSSSTAPDDGIPRYSSQDVRADQQMHVLSLSAPASSRRLGPTLHVGGIAQDWKEEDKVDIKAAGMESGRGHSDKHGFGKGGFKRQQQGKVGSSNGSSNNGGNNSNGGRGHGGRGNTGHNGKGRGGSSIIPEHYKTEICRSFRAHGKCEYESLCQFAHGVGELRPRHFGVKYKTQLCRNYHLNKTCRFGSRCKFIHDEQRMQVSETEFWLVSPSENLVRVEVVENQARLAELTAAVAATKAAEAGPEAVANHKLRQRGTRSPRSKSSADATSLALGPIPLLPQQELLAQAPDGGRPDGADRDQAATAMATTPASLKQQQVQQQQPSQRQQEGQHKAV